MNGLSKYPNDVLSQCHFNGVAYEGCVSNLYSTSNSCIMGWINILLWDGLIYYYGMD